MKFHKGASKNWDSGTTARLEDRSAGDGRCGGKSRGGPCLDSDFQRYAFNSRCKKYCITTSH